MRGPLAARENDPFPDLPGNRTLDFSTRWYEGTVLLCDGAAALCSDPDELNRAEARMAGKLLRHVKAGLRKTKQQVPAWANGMPYVPPEAPQRPLKGPRRRRQSAKG